MILDELRSVAEKTDPAQTARLAEAIRCARRIFAAGTGRSGLMIRSLAMRLMQIGYDVYVVGETTTPAIGAEDLLLIASGSGETGSLKTIAKRAKEIGSKLAVITINPESTVGSLADYVVRINTVTSKDSSLKGNSIQPGASTFEQMVLLTGDALIIQLTSGQTLEEKNRLLMERHANLE